MYFLMQEFIKKCEIEPSNKREPSYLSSLYLFTCRFTLDGSIS